MRTITLPVLAIILANFLSLSCPQVVTASGYRPVFDSALKEADLIVVGDITRAWFPKDRREPSQEDSAHDEGMLYRMTIHEIYKGSVKPGEDITLWDPYSGSTAGWHVKEGSTYVMFLVEAELSEFQLNHFDYGSQQLFGMIRGAKAGSDNFDGEIFSLNMALRQPPADIRDAFEAVLNNETNRYILHYVVTHWPSPMTERDVSLFEEVISKYSGDAYVASYAIGKLADRGHSFGDEEFLNLLKTSSWTQRERLLRMVDARNIELCQEQLFSWLLDEEPGPEQDTIELLARLCPDYLKQQLRTRDTPFWKLIPCLQALGINGSAVGKKDFSSELLALNPNTIRDIGGLYQGKRFHGVLAIEDPKQHEQWAAALPLLEPLLQQADSPIRRLVVGLLRTFGTNVRRFGDHYMTIPHGEPATCPIRLELQPTLETYKLGQPVKLVVRETALRDNVWLSFKGDLGWEVHAEGGSTVMSGGAFDAWDEVDIPRAGFTELTEDQRVESEEDIASYIHRPGRYRVTTRKVYPYDGGSVGLDAWTGMAFSNEIRIRVVE